MDIDRNAITSDGLRYRVRGYCAQGFEAVADRFQSNFAEGAELGAAVSVVVDGETMVDLWGGNRDRDATPWERDTIVCMMSVSKPFSALCIFLLADRGLIDIDSPVARYWPEFAQAGKADLPIRYVLDHRAGLPAVAAPRGAIYDWDSMVKALEAQAPLWPPGSAAGYHVLTQGFILGEIVRRVSGLSLGASFQREFAGPLGIDFFIGTPESDQRRCATLFADADNPLFTRILPDTISLGGKAWAQLNAGEDFNTTAWRSAEISSANGHGNARAVARLYGMLAAGGSDGERRYLRGETIATMATEQHALTEIVNGRTYHQASGVLLNSPPVVWMGPNPKAFGHHGVGGSVGFADPDARLGFSYCTNLMHAGLNNGPRAGGLIEASFAALGKHTSI